MSQQAEFRGLAMGIKAGTFVPIHAHGSTLKIGFPKRDLIGFMKGKLLIEMEIPVGSSYSIKLKGETIRVHFPRRDKIVIEGDRENVIIGKRTQIRPRT